MTKSNGMPCIRCGTNEWDKSWHCKKCKREYDRLWARSNPDRVAEKASRWQKANPDKRAENCRRYQKAHPEKANAKSHHRRTLKTKAGGSYTAAEWQTLCNHYGNKCLSCGRADVKLTADHIKPVSKGGSSNIENIQPLCKSCNSEKKDRHIDYRPDAGPLRWLQAKLFG